MKKPGGLSLSWSEPIYSLVFCPPAESALGWKHYENVSRHSLSDAVTAPGCPAETSEELVLSPGINEIFETRISVSSAV